MKDKTSKLTQQSKKTYTKPELKQVPLRPQESVLGFCKTQGSHGPVIANCNVPVRCSTIGS
jgi:hypothetical protein